MRLGPIWMGRLKRGVLHQTRVSGKWPKTLRLGAICFGKEWVSERMLSTGGKWLKTLRFGPTWLGRSGFKRKYCLGGGVALT